MKKLLLLFFLLLSLLGFGQHHMMHVLAAQETGGTSPYYSTSGSLATSTTSGTVNLTVTAPATVDANDILICQFATASASTFSAPSGWDLYTYAEGINISVAMFYRRATGSEDGTGYIFTANAGAGVTAGIIRLFKGGITSGDPFVNTTDVTDDLRTTTTVDPYLITNDYTLGIILMYEEDDYTITTSGTGWTENVENTTAAGTDMTFVLATQGFESTGNTPSASFTTSTAAYTNAIRTLLRSE